MANVSNSNYLKDYGRYGHINPNPFESGMYIKSNQSTHEAYTDNLVKTIGYSSLLPEVK